MIPKSDWLKSVQRLKRKKNYFGIASLFYLNYTQSHLQSLTFPYIPLLNEHYVNGVLWTEIIYLMIASMLLTSCPSNQYFWGYLNVILCILKVVCILVAQEHPFLLSKLRCKGTGKQNLTACILKPHEHQECILSHLIVPMKDQLKFTQ